MEKKTYLAGTSRQALVDMLIDDISDCLNERYAFYEIDTNEELDVQWTDCVVEALEFVKGNVQSERD